MRAKMLLGSVAVIGMLTGFSPVARAFDQDQADKARVYLQKDAVAKDALGLLHTGATYQGTKGAGNLEGRQRQRAPAAG